MGTADGTRTAAIRTALRTSWRRPAGECMALPVGLNGRSWSVLVDGQPHQAKLVPVARRAPFEAGLAAAEFLAAQGMPAATPVRTVGGGVTVTLAGDVLALLRPVPGRPLDPRDPVDQQWWGDALGNAHRLLTGFCHHGPGRFHWVRPDAPHLDVADWVRPAVAAAVAAIRKLCVTDQLTYGLLHTDPTPDAFRLDPQTGRLGLVDWGPAFTGPLVYDLACAVRYAGDADAARDLVDGYLAVGLVPKEEVDAALATMLRFRWAVEADHMARTVSEAEPAGGAEAAGEGWRALGDTRAALAPFGQG